MGWEEVPVKSTGFTYTIFFKGTSSLSAYEEDGCHRKRPVVLIIQTKGNITILNRLYLPLLYSQGMKRGTDQINE